MFKQSQYIRAKRSTRAAAGLCTDCGCHPPAEGYKRCRECIDAALERKRRVRVGLTELPEDKALDAKLSALGRCKCGLLRPCESCLPTIGEVSGRRQYAGIGWILS